MLSSYLLGIMPRNELSSFEIDIFTFGLFPPKFGLESVTDYRLESIWKILIGFLCLKTT